MNFKQLIKRITRIFGFEITRYQLSKIIPVDVPPLFVDIYQKVRPYTMTSPERIFSLCEAVKYLQHNNIEGDFVECGVWKGGSMMAIAETLLSENDTSKDLYLFDTFEGMSAPSSHDVDIAGSTAESLLAKSGKEVDGSLWCYASLDAVKAALKSTGYPGAKIHFIKGLVENTIPGVIPDKIALLRLDTDWYDSTKHEMEHLFPRLVKGGVLILDDYGHWQGAKKAVDDYIKENNIKILLNRIDYSGRMAVKVD